jgi:hypothetical protein
VTNGDGTNPSTLYINRSSKSSLPPLGEESQYVDHVILVAGAKIVRLLLIFILAFIHTWSVA